MTLLERLTELIRARSDSSRDILELALHPATRGHLGEFIGALIFDVDLPARTPRRRFQGQFRAGPLAGRSVSVQFRGGKDRTLDIRPGALPDDYLILTGPRGGQASGGAGRWTIYGACLFDAQALVDGLREQGVKAGPATVVPRSEWGAAEVYPTARNPRLVPSEEQRRLLRLFSPDPGDENSGASGGE